MLAIATAGGALAGPVITGISPDSGGYLVSTSVTISGSGFTGTTNVRAGFSAAGTVVVVNDSTITAVIGSSFFGSTGTANVTVTTGAGTSPAFVFNYIQFRPTVTSLSSYCGRANDAVEVFGPDINEDGEVILFGAATAAIESGNGSGELGVRVPAGSGTVHVTSHTNGGDSAPTTADLFTYGPVPGVGDVSPASGTPAGGTSVTISGGCFTGATAVSFGGTAAASFAVHSDGSITAVSPAGAVGPVDITVTTPQGTSPTQTGAVFTYAAAATNGTTTDTGAATAEFMQDFFDASGNVVLANMPSEDRRIDRLNGITSTVDPAAALMGYLPELASGQMPTPTLSASTAAIAAITGQPKSRFDAWFQSTLGLFSRDGISGPYGLASAGADYLVTDGLLLGGYVQMNATESSKNANGGSIGGIGWLAGPYATARLTDNLYLDILAGAGTSSNHVSLDGSSTDHFLATSWLASSALIGDFRAGGWTISPTVRFSYYQTTANGYTTAAGTSVGAVTTGLGEIAIGPALSYRFDFGGGNYAEPGVRVDGLVNVTRTDGKMGFSDPHGRIEGSLHIGSAAGASLNVSAAYNGIASRSGQSKSASLSLAVPLR